MKHSIPAFPISPEIWETHPDFHGLTKREWFAGKCDPTIYNPLSAYEQAYGRVPTITELAEYVTSIRFIEADALLAASAKGIDDGR